VVCRGG